MIPESGSKEGRYAKLLVEVDLTKPLIRGTKLRCNGESRWVDFKYENLPIFFFYCGMVGHGERRCVRKNVDSQNSDLHEGQFGDWLRVVKGRGTQKNGNWGRKDEGAQAITQVQAIANEGGSSGIDLRAGQNSFVGESRVREIRTHDISSKEREHGISKKNEGQLVKGQHEIRGEKEGNQGGLESPADKSGKKEEGARLEMPGTKIDKSDGGVLLEIDQNKDGAVGMCLENRKHGSWKRRARAPKATSEKENAQGKDDCMGGLGSKRAFVLRDEVETVEDEAQLGKKPKTGEENQQQIDSLVEAASHKWPQLDK